MRRRSSPTRPTCRASATAGGTFGRSTSTRPSRRFGRWAPTARPTPATSRSQAIGELGGGVETRVEAASQGAGNRPKVIETWFVPADAVAQVSEPAPTLSVLDLAIVGEGSSHAEALQNSVDLAQAVERLGYHRHWVAEHHNIPGIASSSPPVLAAALAAKTERMRIGAGGVMLPNHPPLVVAEQFGMLEALYPGRIDLGIGRAPGTDQITASALRRSAEPLSDEDFPRAADRADRLLQGRVLAARPLPPRQGGPRQRRHARDLAARLVGLLGSARRAARAAVLLRPPLHAPATPTPRSSSTARASGPPSTSTSRT